MTHSILTLIFISWLAGGWVFADGRGVTGIRTNPYSNISDELASICQHGRRDHPVPTRDSAQSPSLLLVERG